MSSLGGLSAAGRHARDGSVLTVQRLTGKGHGGSRCKCLVLPEAEHCACVRVSSLPPLPSAPKRYRYHPLRRSAQEGGCLRAHRLPLPVTLFPPPLGPLSS